MIQIDLYDIIYYHRLPMRLSRGYITYIYDGKPGFINQVAGYIKQIYVLPYAI